MTNSPPEPPQRPSLTARIASLISNPALLVAGGVAVGLGMAGYWGLRYWVYRHLPSYLESQLENFLQRPVAVGGVEEFSLLQIRLGRSTVPPTPTDADRLSIEGIAVGVNPFPILWGQPLGLKVEVDRPNLYLDREPQGKWIEIPKIAGEAKELPLGIDADIRIEEADIALQPNLTQKPVTVQASGKFNYLYRDRDRQGLSYDLDSRVLGNPLAIRGKTALETGQSQIELQVDRLNLQAIAGLFNGRPLQVARGRLDARLDADLPSFDQFTQARGNGRVTLKGLEAQIVPLNTPLKLNFDLQLQGQKADVQQLQVSLGKLKAEARGSIDWQEGYKLQATVNSLLLEDLPKLLPLRYPFPITGAIDAKMQVTGKIDQPKVVGTLQNSKPLTVDRVPIKTLQTPFQADLKQISFDRAQIFPREGGAIQAKGRLTMNLDQTLKAGRPINWQEMPLAIDFTANLPIEDLIAPYYRSPEEVSLGKIAARGQIKGTFSKLLALARWRSSDLVTFGQEAIAGSGEILWEGFNLALRDTVLNSAGGRIRLASSGDFQSRQWKAGLVADRFDLSPLLPVACSLASCPLGLKEQTLALNTANIQLRGNLDRLELDRLAGNASFKLAIDGSALSVDSTLERGRLQARATAKRLDLGFFLPQLTAPVQIERGQLDIRGSIASLLTGKTADLRQLNANFDAALALAEHPVTTSGSLQQGQLQASLNLHGLPLRAIAPQLPIPVTLRGGLVRLSGNVQPVIHSLGSDRLDTRSLSARADLAVDTDGGRLDATARIDRNQLQASISGQNLNPQRLLRPLANSELLSTLSPVDTRVKLSGNLDSLFASKAELPLSLDRFEIASGRQNLSARGSLRFERLFSRPDLARANLQVDARGNLDDLPLSQLLALLPARQDFLPQQVALSGKGRFQGELSAQNLFSAPTAANSLQLKGKVALDGLAFNDRRFEPRLTGTLNARTGGKIELDLRGREDILLASLSPCTLARCPAPYLPAALEIRQRYDSDRPLIARAQLEGDRLAGQVEQFPLSLFKLTPGKSYGIPGYLDGTANLDFALNPYNLAGSGNLRIERLRIGRLEARALEARLAFADRIARLENAKLQLGESAYNVSGALNLETGGIEGKLAIARGRVQDIRDALKISDIDSLLAFLRFQPLPPAEVADLTPDSIGSPEATIAELVNLLAQVDRKIRERAKAFEGGGIPTSLDVQGEFNAQIQLGGTLRNPTLKASLDGNRWTWQPFLPFPNIVEPLGLVMQNTSVIPVERVSVRASLEGGVLSFDPARLQIHDTEVAIAGQLGIGDRQTKARFQIDNLSLDTVGTIFKLPIDASGQINIAGELGGTLLQPTLTGEFDFVEGSINARSLDLLLEGKFSYQNNRLRLATAPQSSFYAYLDAPLPPTPDSNEAEIQLRLNTQSLKLISAFTQDQLTWLGGEGSLDFQAKVRFNPGDTLNLNAIANGKLAFQDAAIQSASLPYPLRVNGEVLLTQEGIQVDRLEGKFDSSQILIAGNLPLFDSPSPVANPLTIQIERGEVNIENLYTGQLDAQVVVRGSALNPSIGGGVQLAKGEVFIPQTPTQEDGVTSAFTRWSRVAPRRPSPIRPQLDGFQVVLRDLRVEQQPFYQFEFGGDLVFDGSLENLQAIRPKGSILLDRGRISFIDTRFLLDRRQRNEIVFDPNQGLLNPALNLKMRTIVSELPASQRLRSADSNEIPDDNITRIQRIDIGLVVRGTLSQLLPNLNQNAAEICRPEAGLQNVRTGAPFSDRELARLTQCLELLVAQGNSDEQLLNNPAIRLTSTPPRSQGEIVRLLAEQFIVLAESLQGKSTGQIAQVGIVQLALPMVFQGVVYDIETAISNGINSTDFRIVPFLEAIYEVDRDGFIRLNYDYSASQVRVQYEKRF